MLYKEVALTALVWCSTTHFIQAREQKNEELTWQETVDGATEDLLADPVCLAAGRAGVDLHDLGVHISHTIHDITVEDIQYFFNETISEDNNIPTSDTNLTSPQMVLPSVPSKPSDFEFPGARMMDWILLNDDKTEEFMLHNQVHSYSHMEKLVHQLHMAEMWHRMTPMYSKIKLTMKEDKLNDICPCLVSEQTNGIIKYLKLGSLHLRGDDGAKLLIPGHLTDSTTWKQWKLAIQGMMLNDAQLKTACLYLYCKLWYSSEPRPGHRLHFHAIKSK